ncbi:MAG: hypothetical protein ABIN94_18475 [Ferruginibacter sp.]
MPSKSIKQSSNPLLQLIKNLLSKIFQKPDVYPVKYYKKARRLRH